MFRLFVLAALIATASFAACKKNSSPATTEQLLTADSSSIRFPSGNFHRDSFNISSDGSWIISIYPASTDWLELSQTSGTGNTKIYVKTIGSNSGATPRMATIIIAREPNSGEPVNIAVTQDVYRFEPWSKLYGGSKDDELFFVINSDPGYIAIGNTSGNGANIPGYHGEYDVWMVKTDPGGNIEWQKAYGGSGADLASGAIRAFGGGYLVVGKTTSNDGDVSDGPGNAIDDGWILRVDEVGNVIWKKAVGTTGKESFTSITATSNGSYLLCGEKNGDAWLCNIDEYGSVLWEKTYGSSAEDVATSIVTILDHEFYVGGYTSASGADGDIPGSKGAKDAWVFKVDGQGNLLWSKTFGGSGDDVFKDVQLTYAGGVMAGGYTASSDGDVSNNYGDLDAWMVKLDKDGNLVSEKTYGGTGSDVVESLIDGGAQDSYFTSGWTSSADGDAGDEKGNSDAWHLLINLNGDVVRKLNFGGSNNDVAMSALQIGATNYISVGRSTSNDGDLFGLNGLYDGWLWKFSY